MTSTFSEHQLDALRELANIASGTAATALAQMLDHPVDLNVPSARALGLADAAEACGPAEELVTSVILPVLGEVEGLVALLISAIDVNRLCALIGVEAGSEVGDSALSELGNILCASYLGGMAAMTGLELSPGTPHLRTDMLGAVLSTLLVHDGAAESVIMLDSELTVAGQSTAVSFLLLPHGRGADALLAPLGLARSA